jgi:hypothetical protein
MARRKIMTEKSGAPFLDEWMNVFRSVFGQASLGAQCQSFREDASEQEA